MAGPQGAVDQELLARNEYLAAENRILAVRPACLLMTNFGSRALEIAAMRNANLTVCRAQTVRYNFWVINDARAAAGSGEGAVYGLGAHPGLRHRGDPPSPTLWTVKSSDARQRLYCGASGSGLFDRDVELKRAANDNTPRSS